MTAVLCCAVLYYTILCCTVLYYTVLYCTVLYCAVLYCTVVSNRASHHSAHRALVSSQATTITENDQFLLLACDGLFDVFSPEEVVTFVKAHVDKHGDAQKCCQVWYGHSPL